MNDLSDFVDAWGTAMVRASWQAGLLALVVWAVCRTVPSIPARFQAWLWRLALLKFVVAVVWQMPVEIPVLPAPPVATEGVGLDVPTDSISVNAPAVSSPTMSSATRRPVNARGILLLAWLAGVGWSVTRITRACRTASRLRTASRVCDDSLLREAAANVAQSVGLRIRPALLEADGQGSPLLQGIVRPAIVFPAGTLPRLGLAERELVLGHELAHLRHGDIAWGLFAACVRALFFFHPAAWLCERKLRLAQEVAADELAMSVRGETPAEYARQLLQIVLKLGPRNSDPVLSVAVAGTHQSLKERFAAMRFILPLSHQLRIVWTLFLYGVALVGVVPWGLVAAEPPAAPAAAEGSAKADKPKPASTSDQPLPTLKQGKGKFVSFKDGTLTLEGAAGPLVWKEINSGTKTYLGLGEGSDKDRGYQPVETLDALSKVKAGTRIYVGSWFGYEKRHGIFIGEVPGKAIGTFVSFKDGSLSLLAKDRPGGSFTKKYGNSLFIRNLPADLPVEESVDGGAFERIGTVKEVLADVAEGTVVTVHFLGEGNTTLIQLGVPRK